MTAQFYRNRALGFTFLTVALLFVHMATFHLTPLLLMLVPAFLAVRNWMLFDAARSGAGGTPTRKSFRQPQVPAGFACTYFDTKLLRVLTRRRGSCTVLKGVIEFSGGVRETLDEDTAAEQLTAGRAVVDLGDLDAVLDDPGVRQDLGRWLRTGEARSFYVLTTQTTPPGRVRSSAKASRTLE